MSTWIRKTAAYVGIAATTLLAVTHLMIDQLLYFPEAAHDSKPEDHGLPYEEVWLTAPDGVKLHAWWTGAPSAPTTVLFFHGNAGNISHRLDRVAALGEKSVRFFLLDYRGYGKSGGKPSEEGLYRDAAAAYEYVRGKAVPPGNLFLFGESLGGAVAAELALRVPCAGLILESTFTSLREIAGKHYPFIPASFVPDAFPTSERIGKIRTPLLVLHGTNDEIVPLEMGRTLFERATEPKSFVEIPDALHNDVYVVGGERYQTAVREFLNSRKLSK